VKRTINRCVQVIICKLYLIQFVASVARLTEAKIFNSIEILNPLHSELDSSGEVSDVNYLTTTTTRNFDGHI